MFYYLDESGNTQGPHSPEDLREQLANGMITLGTMTAQEGDDEWKPLKDFEAFNQSNQPAQKPPLTQNKSAPPSQNLHSGYKAPDSSASSQLNSAQNNQGNLDWLKKAALLVFLLWGREFFKSDGWQSLLNLFLFAALAAVALGLVYLIYTRILTESYIEGDDPKKIRVRTENKSLLSAVVLTFMVPIVVSLFLSSEKITPQNIAGEVAGAVIGFSIVFCILKLASSSHIKKMLGSSLRVTASHLPDLHERALNVANRLGMEKPDLYVINGDDLNAYATGFKGSYAVIINSKVLEELSPDEVDFILGHEFSHIKFRHTFWLGFLGGSSEGDNPLATVLSWFMGVFSKKWQRDTEYTCDRGGLVGCNSRKAAISALCVLLAGPKLGRSLNMVELREQQSILLKKGVLAKLNLGHDTHPYLIHRIFQIQEADLPVS